MRGGMIVLLLGLIQLAGLAQALQQCKLVSHLQDDHHDQAPIVPTPTSTPSASSTTITPSSTRNDTIPSPTLAPFKYGTEKIRGVNLYVSISYHTSLLMDSNLYGLIHLPHQWRMVRSRGMYTIGRWYACGKPNATLYQM